MARRPNPFLHMTTWGIGSGFIIAILYILMMLGFSDTSGANLNLLDFLSNLTFWQLTLFFGALPGAILGILSGLNIWFVTRKIQGAINVGRIVEKRPVIYVTTMALVAVAAINLIAAYFSAMSLYFIPLPFIAAIVAAYASHRYTERLLSWRSSLEIRKSKKKNQMLDTSRLQDNDTNIQQTGDIVEDIQSISKSAYD